MRIALDGDDTLVYTGPTLSDYYRKSVDPKADMPEHIWSSRWPVWGGDKVLWKEWYNTWINSAWFTKMPPFPGALEAVAKLKAAGHELFVVSAGLSSATSRRKEHFEKLFGPVFNEVICVDSSAEKPKVLRELGIHAFVDDDINNLAAAAPILGIAIRQPANAHQVDEIRPLPRNVRLVDDWAGAVRILEAANAKPDRVAQVIKEITPRSR